MTTPDDGPGHSVYITIEGENELPIMLANAFFVQASGDGTFVLTLAQAAPPIVVGTAEEQRQKLMKIRAVIGKPLSRVAISAVKLQELVDILQGTLDAHKVMMEEYNDATHGASRAKQQPNQTDAAAPKRGSTQRHR